jgi:hypothetical protein
VLLVDEDVPASDEILPLSIMGTAWDMRELAIEACLHEDQGIFGGGDVAVISRLERACLARHGQTIRCAVTRLTFGPSESMKIDKERGRRLGLIFSGKGRY